MPQSREQLLVKDEKVKVPKRVMQGIYADLASFLSQKDTETAFNLIRLWINKED